MQALAADLQERGAEVNFDLQDPGLDLILLIDPRHESPTSSITPAQIMRYLVFKNPRTIVVHRVNECDERKKTTGVNRRYIDANRCADHTVFVSRWLEDLLVENGLSCPSRSVILNGSDRSLFKPNNSDSWDGDGPLRLVTHHWSAHQMKGFDIYRRLDEMLGNESFRKRFSFTYIGNLPQGFRFENSDYIEPLHGEELAAKLHPYHVYLTASQNEPGPNHQNEGACSGMPLLYRKSGGLSEYCSGFGLSFTAETFTEKLEEMRKTYHQWKPLMGGYPHTAERMCENYFNLFQDLLSRREEFMANRNWSRKLPWLLVNLLRR